MRKTFPWDRAVAAIAAALLGMVSVPAPAQAPASAPAAPPRHLLADANLPAPPEPTLFVDGAHPAANDTNPGTKDKPWKTLAKAAATAQAGDVVLVAQGAYHERVAPAHAGQKGRPITFLAAGKVVTRGFVLKKDYLCVRGFTITAEQRKDTPYEHGVDCSGAGCQVLGNTIDRPNGMGISAGGAECLIRGNTVRYADGIGIVISGRDHVMEYNDVSHSIKVRANDADASRFFGTGHVIRGNYFHDILHSEAPGAHVDAFQTYDSTGQSVQNILIEDNFCHNIASQMLMASGTRLKKSSDVTIRNNVFHTVGAIAINVHGIRNMRVHNNLFIGGKWVAVRLHDGCTGSQVYNNIVLGIDAVWVDAASREGTTADYNLTDIRPSGQNVSGPHDLAGRSPLFANPARLDFRLKAGSPGADAGRDLSESAGFAADKDGVRRPADKAWDMGPYEGPARP